MRSSVETEKRQFTVSFTLTSSFEGLVLTQVQYATRLELPSMPTRFTDQEQHAVSRIKL